MSQITTFSTNSPPLKRKVLFDTSYVAIVFIATFLIASHYNFSDHLYQWTQQFENTLDIDELLPALIMGMLSLLWFSKRRINESKLLVKNNHALLKRILEIQEIERKRIAQDLHDELGQYLSAIKVQATNLSNANNYIDAKLIALSITASAHHAYHTTHHLIQLLRPPTLDDLGLSAALEQLLNNWQQTTVTVSSIKTQYHLEILGEIDYLDEAISIMLYRVVQEALSNVAKYAQAKHASVFIHAQNSYLELRITDDGIGFNIDKKHSRFGILGMAERVEALGGKFKLTSRTALGTTIHIQIKLKDTDDQFTRESVFSG